jgi:zinc transport system ATP-binding protein
MAASPMLDKPRGIALAGSMAGEPLVALTGVSVMRGGRAILSGIDISLQAGEILTIIGPNGGGKTTLLKVVLGLVKPDRGQVSVLPGLRIGYVPQRLQLDPTLPMTVRRLMRLTRRYADAEVIEALSETGVAQLIDSDVTALSGGEFQRLLIARALLAKPELLVLDEPVQGVDFTGEVALYEKIAEIRDRYGCGVLLVSHDLHVVMAASDRVICLNAHVCCAGVPGEVAEAPEYLRLFGPRAAGAVALYQHHHDHTHGLHGEVVGAEDCTCGHEHPAHDHEHTDAHGDGRHTHGSHDHRSHGPR